MWFQQAPKRRDCHLKIPEAHHRIRLRPKCFADHLAMDRGATLRAEEAQQRANPRFDGREVDGAPVDGGTELAKTPEIDHRIGRWGLVRPSSPEGFGRYAGRRFA
jgi:hypothetical protein